MFRLVCRRKGKRPSKSLDQPGCTGRPQKWETDTRGDVVDVVLDVLRDVVSLGADSGVAGLRVLVLVEICVQQILEFLTSRNKCQPALVV